MVIGSLQAGQEIIRGKLNELGVETKMGGVRIAYREAGNANVQENLSWDREHMGKKSKAQCKVQVALTEMPSDLTSDDHQTKSSLDTLHSFHAHGNVIHVSMAGMEGKANLTEFVESIVEGIFRGLMRGPLLQYAVTGATIHVTDVLIDSDSSPSAFSTCLNQSISKICKQHVNIILEPIMKVVINCPKESVGTLTSNIVSIRGQVIDVDFGNETDDAELITNIPLSSITGWATTLKSLTAGRGSFRMTFMEYQVVAGEHRKQIFIDTRGYE